MTFTATKTDRDVDHLSAGEKYQHAAQASEYPPITRLRFRLAFGFGLGDEPAR